MPRLICSRQALLDVQRLYHLHASKNVDAAKRAVSAVRQGVRVLTYQSRIGRPVDDMPDEFREWMIDFGDSGYLVRYRIGSDAITILAVRHQREVGF